MVVRSRPFLRQQIYTIIITGLAAGIFFQPCEAIWFRILFGRCTGFDVVRCGFFSLGIAMFRGVALTENCTDSCALFPILMDDDYECGTCFPPPTSAPTVSPAPTMAVFDMDVDVQSIPIVDRSYFRRGRDKWTDVIRGDLLDVDADLIPDTPGGDPGDCEYPDIVDDVYVCCLYADIDGKGKVVGRAVPRVMREDGFPITGRLTIDADDVDSLKEDGQFQTVIEHELGHVLGFGSLWKQRNLTEEEGRKNCIYKGEKATREYRAITGCDEIPNDCGHWDEDCLEPELMTSKLDGGTNPLSKITIGSMEDFGYEVDYASADFYWRDDIGDEDCFCNRRSLSQSDDDVLVADQIDYDNTTYSATTIVGFNGENGIARNKRRLSSEGYQYAWEYGLSILDEEAKSRGDDSSWTVDRPEAMFVADKMVNILYKEDGNVFSVLVTR